MAEFLPDDPDEEERQRALAAALRRQETLGLIGQLSGDKVLGNVGGSLLENAARGQQRLDSGAQRRLQLQLEAKKDQENRDYQAQTLGLQQQHLNLARQTAGRDKFTPLPTAGGYVTYDPRTGSAVPIQGADGKPLMPVKFGDSPGDEQGALRKMGDAFQGQLKRGGQAGKNLERFQAAERLEASIVDPQGNIQPLNPGRVTEAYSNLNTLLGGSQSLGALEHFLPHTARGDLAKALEYVTGHPQDAGAQEFLKGALEIAKREKAVIGAQNARLFGQIAPTYAPTLKKYQSARNALKGYGITEDMLDPETFLPREVADPVKAGEQAVGPGNDKSPAQRKLRVHQLLGENPNLTDADIAKVLKGEGFNVR